MRLNFLPYPKGNRDEWISKADVERLLCGPFINTFPKKDPEYIKESIDGLNDYFAQKIQGIQKSKDDSIQKDDQ